MRRLSARRVAQVAITVQFLALVRTAAEFFRLRAVEGAAFTVAGAAPWVTGTMIAAVGAWSATTFYFFGRHRAATGAVALTIIVMLVYKLVVLR